jgi:CMP-N,N'-diacetyllegionaminic acid synthase
MTKHSRKSRMRLLAFVPARSGSKSVPDKNVAPLHGVPLAAYSLWTARKSGLFDEILLSTDSPAYLASLKPYGARQDYLRPAKLARDTSPTLPAVLHALDWFARRGEPEFDAVMILQPTAPFRTPRHVARAVSMLEQHPRATSVVGVRRLHDLHPARIKKLRGGVWLEDFGAPEPDGSRRQDLKPAAYVRNGTIYLSRTSTLRNQHSILGHRICSIEMPEANSINVDTPFDFLVAESALRYGPYRRDLSIFQELLESQEPRS